MKKLGFGVMRLPLLEGEGKEVDMNAARAMFDAFMAAGFNYFDTAYVYHGGKSEEILRELIVKRYPRESFTITDKLPLFDKPTADELEGIFQTQLTRCGVDFFDYYWIHNINSGDLDLAEEIGAFDFIARKKAEGKTKHIGFSYHDSAELLDKILTKHPEIEFVQLQINYLDWEDPRVQSRACYEVCCKHQKPVIVMEPVKGGRLAVLPERAEAVLKAQESDASPASWALRFAASLENVMVVLSGMSTMAQVSENVSLFDALRPLDACELAAVEKAAGEIRASVAVGCTACRYCVDGCPQNIPIPEIFKVYNDHKMFPFNGHAYAVSHYAAAIDGHGSAADCIGCRQCEEHCPQHLDIPRWLAQIADELR